MNATVHTCECCGEPIKGMPYVDKAVGLVDAQCAHELRDATKKLNKAGMRDVFLGECPDHQNEAP
ncbi:hypothetical protein OKA05_01985 [Luteolibacter arcticus]|uniref:Uncharacterized protein n=1 Tax=Luteolibacter arcticus TaxID=1581411 RepID=A0ABT3GCE1_9BACT|nr:hypothetical protein [Luteolibacter arcticus]MCW1921302.1 hypothetical protein [Luteolibacter arcticus]